MNIAATTRFIDRPANRAVLEDLWKKGEMSEIVLLPRFSPPDRYYEYYGLLPQTGLRALDDITKSTGYPNWNNKIYIAAAQEYERNALMLIRKFPADYLKAVANQLYLFFNFTPNLLFDEIEQWGQLRTDTIWSFFSDIGRIYLLPVVLLLCFLMGIVGLIINLTQCSQPEIALRLFLLFTLLYVLAVANLMELGEGNFLRIPVDPVPRITRSRFIHRLSIWQNS